MNPWLETAGAALLAAGGFFFAIRLARIPKPYWIGAYCLAFAAVILFGIERYTTGLEFVPPFSWLVVGRMRYLTAAFAGPILILTPSEKLPRRRDRLFLRSFAVLFLIAFVVMPFVLPAMARNDLSRLQTRIDVDGVCLQQTGYTCGPAAAVTALRRLGLPGDEGKLAIWSRTSQYGTEPSQLAEAMRAHYGADGLGVEYRRFTNIRQLEGRGNTLAVVKYDFLTDHFVAVLEVTNGEVVVGDPLNGKVKYSEEEFTNIWRYSGITLIRRTSPR